MSISCNAVRFLFEWDKWSRTAASLQKTARGVVVDERLGIHLDNPTRQQE